MKEMRSSVYDFVSNRRDRKSRRVVLFLRLTSLANEMLHRGGGAKMRLGAVTYHLTWERALHWIATLRDTLPEIYYSHTFDELLLSRPSKDDAPYYREVAFQELLPETLVKYV